MGVVVVTGSCGLVGAEACLRFGEAGADVVGIDNDMRASFFGPEASTAGARRRLVRTLGRRYRHVALDVRDREGVERLFRDLRRRVDVVVHTAAQPSHDWAAWNPVTDFEINALGTQGLLEATRRHSPEAVFVFTSTNKVYGDRPNELPFVEHETRWDLPSDHPLHSGIDEDMPIDASLHSLFGASKLAADVLVQEYGRYFGLRTACFRAGTLTGPAHAAAELHGFLAYVVRCALGGIPYTIRGYGGKQVRDVLHARDLVTAFVAFAERPRVAAVYNVGGGRRSNISVVEAIALTEQVCGVELETRYVEEERVGDHIWWISDNRRLAGDYPGWDPTCGPREIVEEITERNRSVWRAKTPSAR